MAKSERPELGDNMLGHYRSIHNHSDVIGQQTIEFGLKTKTKSGLLRR